MKQFTIEYGATALEDLDGLPPRQRQQIVRKIERLERRLHGDIKRLQNADYAGCGWEIIGCCLTLKDRSSLFDE